LINDFNIFLPPGFKIGANTHTGNTAAQNPKKALEEHPTSEQHAAQASSTPKVANALDYLGEVKRRFADEPQKYEELLDIMKKFKNQECVHSHRPSAS
jgi:histone deacetylase complex regulatory component SIN3